MTVRGHAVDLAYAGGWSAVRWMPESVARPLFRSIADRTTERDGERVRQLRRNLARVRPDLSPTELDALVHEGMRRYLRYWREAFRLPGMSREQIVSAVRPIDVERLDEGLSSGRGIVCALPHMGNWDLAGAWFAVTRGRLTTVAERLQPESLFERFLAYRESLGMEVLPLTGGPRVLPVLAQRLRAGGMVALLGDRDLTRHGIVVDFFGAPATMPAGPAALALNTAADLVPVTLWYDDDDVMCLRFHPRVEIDPDVDRKKQVAAAVQAVADVFATGIEAHPADWHMLQALWTEDLDADRLARRTADGDLDLEGAT
jgi:KDO2-lipid IV(A) lauroyltransferase